MTLGYGTDIKSGHEPGIQVSSNANFSPHQYPQNVANKQGVKSTERKLDLICHHYNQQ